MIFSFKYDKNARKSWIASKGLLAGINKSRVLLLKKQRRVEGQKARRAWGSAAQPLGNLGKFNFNPCPVRRKICAAQSNLAHQYLGFSSKGPASLWAECSSTQVAWKFMTEDLHAMRLEAFSTRSKKVLRPAHEGALLNLWEIWESSTLIRVLCGGKSAQLRAILLTNISASAPKAQPQFPRR